MTPIPTHIYRLIHIDNLTVCLARRGLHAPNFTPDDGLVYRTIHNVDVQRKRQESPVRCGPADRPRDRGLIHDYVSFYFGVHSPMLLNLKTGRVDGYAEGQAPLVYLRSTAQAVAESGQPYVFSNGHGIARLTDWFDDLADLGEVDWGAVGLRYWADQLDDMDRQRRKQAEFLIHRSCAWGLVHEIGVFDRTMRHQVETVLAQFEPSLRPPVSERSGWYY